MGAGQKAGHDAMGATLLVDIALGISLFSIDRPTMQAYTVLQKKNQCGVMAVTQFILGQM
jgi:hypothetical protein